MKGIRNKERDYRIWIVAVVLIIAFVGILGISLLTLTIHPDEPSIQGAGYPYSTTFEVLLPEGNTIRLGDIEILVLQTGRHIALKIGERREEMQLGQTREIADRTSTVKILGYPVFSTGYQLTATWTGLIDNNVKFRVTLRSSRQIPDWLISKLLPAEIQAIPAPST